MRIAINGFGRIGRVTARILQARKDIELVAVNDLTDNETLAHLFKYDSVHVVFQGEVGYDEQHLILGGKKVGRQPRQGGRRQRLLDDVPEVRLAMPSLALAEGRRRRHEANASGHRSGRRRARNRAVALRRRNADRADAGLRQQ